MDDPRVLMAIVAIAVSSIFSAIGLIMGSRAQKRTNRISVAKRLSDVSFLLSEDITTLARIRSECLREIKRNEASESAGANDRTNSLRSILEKTENAQRELDGQHDQIQKMYQNLEKIAPEKIELIMQNAYSWKAANKGNLEFLLALKKENCA